MKKFMKLLIPAMILVMIAAAFSVFSQAAAAEPLPDKVIYIATTSRGLGDGSSPENAMGNEDDYAQVLADEMVSGTGSSARKKHALRNAYVAATAKGEGEGADYLYKNVTIVLVEDILCEVADAYRASPAEWTLSNPGAPTVITVTSKYNGTDYGAKLILDRTKFPSINMRLNTATIWKDLAVEYRTSETVVMGAGWEPEYMIECAAAPFTVESTVTVTSKDYTDPAAVKDGTRYPAILGGDRYSASYTNGKDAKVTIKGGTWGNVYAGSYGMTAEHNGNLKSAELTIEGGKIGCVFGGTGEERVVSTIDENSTVTIKGGEVAKVCALSGGGVIGICTVKVVGAPKIGELYAMSDMYLGVDPTFYALDLTECTVEKATMDQWYLDNAGCFPEMEIKLPTGYEVPKIPEATVAPETTVTPETTATPETQAPAESEDEESKETNAPVTPDNDKEEGGSNVGLIIGIVAAVVVVAVVVVVLLKKKKA